MEPIVLQRALSNAGIASRRGAEQYITGGRVSVNGKVVTKLGARVDPSTDNIQVDGVDIRAPEAKTYIMLHKPKGVLSAATDDRGRSTVVDLVQSDARLSPVGRLDYDTTGLMLLTDDGDLTYRLTHPSFEHEKEYEAVIRIPKHWGEREVSGMVQRLGKGVVIGIGVRTSPARVSVKKNLGHGTLVISLCIHEGKKHQVRRMINTVGASIDSLKRVRMGPIRLGPLPEGEYRPLTEKEIEQLKKHVA